MSDFRRTKWFLKDETNSYPSLVIQPRISMIAGIDMKGNIYLSLSQSNTNSQVMEMFFKRLVRKLDEDDKYWRSNSVIIMDGAPYHTSNATLDLLKQLDVPVMFLGPHSYDASPIELFFAWFKSADINPRKIPQSKT